MIFKYKRNTEKRNNTSIEHDSCDKPRASFVMYTSHWAGFLMRSTLQTRIFVVIEPNLWLCLLFCFIF